MASLLVTSMLGFTCQAVRVFSHIYSLFRARLCWGGGSVANEGLVVFGGDYSLRPKCYVTCTVCQQTSCHVNTWDNIVTLDMRARIKPLIGAPPTRSLPAERKPAWLVWQLALGDHQERTYLWM